MSASVYILAFAAILAMGMCQAWLVAFIRKPNRRNYPNSTIWERLGAAVVIIFILSIQVGIIEDVF